MKYLSLILLISLSSCVYRVSTTVSYWHHPDKKDSRVDYKKCRELHDNDKQKIKTCLNKNGWEFIEEKKGLK